MNQMFRAGKLLTIAFLAASVWPGESARAYTVTFTEIGGANFHPYTGHTEGPFAVSPIVGEWFKGHRFGKPVPSIFSNSFNSVVQVTASPAGQFTFSSVDLASLTQPNANYSITGFLNNVSVLIASGTIGNLDRFTTVTSPNSSKILDRLNISIVRNGASSYNIDNIVLHRVVPEPSTALLLMGLPLLIHVARRRVC